MAGSTPPDWQTAVCDRYPLGSDMYGYCLVPHLPYFAGAADFPGILRGWGPALLCAFNRFVLYESKQANFRGVVKRL